MFHVPHLYNARLIYPFLFAAKSRDHSYPLRLKHRPTSCTTHGMPPLPASTICKSSAYIPVWCDHRRTIVMRRVRYFQQPNPSDQTLSLPLFSKGHSLEALSCGQAIPVTYEKFVRTCLFYCLIAVALYEMGCLQFKYASPFGDGTK